MTRSIKDAFEAAFNALQENKYKVPGITLEDWAMKNPGEFYKLATKLIPTKLEGKLDADVNLVVATGVPARRPEPVDFA